MSNDDWITVREAAERLQVTRQRIHALIRFGRLKAIRKGKLYYLPRDFEVGPPRKGGRPRKNPLTKSE